MTDHSELIAGIIARHKNARPNAENPAWRNCHHDMDYLITELATQVAQIAALTEKLREADALAAQNCGLFLARCKEFDALLDAFGRASAGGNDEAIDTAQSALRAALSITEAPG